MNLPRFCVPIRFYKKLTVFFKSYFRSNITRGILLAWFVNKSIRYFFFHMSLRHETLLRKFLFHITCFNECNRFICSAKAIYFCLSKLVVIKKITIIVCKWVLLPDQTDFVIKWLSLSGISMLQGTRTSIGRRLMWSQLMICDRIISLVYFVLFRPSAYYIYKKYYTFNGLN